MSFDLIAYSYNRMMERDINDIESCNDISREYGLALTHKQAMDLCITHASALKGVGRVEFSGGIPEKLITAFCDSPYMNEDNYAENLCALCEAFYYYKNETLDKMSDDELIQFMKESFDGNCKGSVSLMISNNLEELCRHIKSGTVPVADENSILADETAGEGAASYQSEGDTNNE